MPHWLFLIPAGLLLLPLVLAVPFGRPIGGNMSILSDLAPLFGDFKASVSAAAAAAVAPLHSRIAELEHLVETGKADLEAAEHLVETGKADLEAAIADAKRVADELVAKNSEVEELTHALAALKDELVASIAPPAPAPEVQAAA